MIRAGGRPRHHVEGDFLYGTQSNFKRGPAVLWLDENLPGQGRKNHPASGFCDWAQVLQSFGGDLA